MRINQFLARHTDLSRRGADKAVTEGRVEINGVEAKLGDTVIGSDRVTFDNQVINPNVTTVTLVFHKPVGFVSSKKGQGSKTIYELLPSQYANLNPIGRLDKESSGLLLMTNDGKLANLLAHPRYQKTKVYEVALDEVLLPIHQQMIVDHGVQLYDGPSKLQLEKLDPSGKVWRVIMKEGRNRQIRRTFDALGYKVKKLHRTHFGSYHLGALQQGKYDIITPNESR